VLLPETSAGETWALSQRILRDVAQYRDARTGRLGISIGIAELSVVPDVESDGIMVSAGRVSQRVERPDDPRLVAS